MTVITGSRGPSESVNDHFWYNCRRNGQLARAMSTQGAGRYSFLLFSFSLWLVQAKLVTISNNQPRTDTMGNVLPIQDG